MNNYNKIRNEIFSFKSPVMVIINNAISYEIKNGICNLEIGLYNNNHIVILSEIPENTGDKITNAFKEIATQVYYKYLKSIDPKIIIWIEHYYANRAIDEYCIPNMKWNNYCYNKINWNDYIFNDVESILKQIKQLS